MKVIAEYIWLDGKKPTAGIRSKTKIIDVMEGTNFDSFVPPIWGFDGSSTQQAHGAHSDCVLKPVRWYPDPIRTKDGQVFPHLLVFNEVFLPDGSVHTSNNRASLREISLQYANEEFLFGIEQEYTLFRQGRVLGFPEYGFPEPQGEYYCGVGSQRVFGRELAEEHMVACLKAKIAFVGINAEVMPGQWEFQIGAVDPLRVSDDLIVARWLLQRIAEDYGLVVSYEPKPVRGDWNGAGAHTNFSTKKMREDSSVFPAIMKRFERKHDEHIAVYGSGNDERLTGDHETCDINTFKYGVSDRGASVRIPWQVNRDRKGYMEDRRPAANIDPYLVVARIMKTTCEEVEESVTVAAFPERSEQQ